MRIPDVLEKALIDPLLSQVESRLEGWADSRRRNFRPPLGSDIEPLEHYRDYASRCVRCGICRGTHLEKIQSHAAQAQGEPEKERTVLLLRSRFASLLTHGALSSAPRLRAAPDVDCGERITSVPT